MNEKTERNKMDSDPMFGAWMKAATDFWGQMAKGLPGAFGNSGQSFGPQIPGMTKVQESMGSILKILQALSSIMEKKGAVDTISKVANVVPEIALRMAEMGWDGYSQFQQQWLEKMGRIGQKTEAYKFEEMDQEIFKVWDDIYQNEFRQLFNIPQVGLFREYEEAMSQFTDRFIVFQEATAEFMSMLYLPIKKSFKVLQDKVDELIKEGKAPDDPKAYYNMWVKILEGHYLTLFQTPEYTECLGKTVNAIGDFTIIKREILQRMMKASEVPTNKEMDVLYKEIYELKKRIKQLERQQEAG